ncbi:MAG TPA: DUF4474 domain-containing protein, partial [Rhodopila sp.]
WIPTSPLAKLVDLAGFLYDPAQDIIYSRMDALQRPLGYAYAYDASALLMDAVIDCEPIFFTAQGKLWMIELWKGQYGLETGCEIGVYNRPLNPPVSYTILDAVVGKRPYDPAHSYFYQSADAADMLEMSFTLKRDGRPFLTRGPERHWWLTGFKWGVYSTTDQLTMDISIKSPAAEVHAGIIAALQAMGYVVRDDGATVGFEFGKPFAPQPWTGNPGLGTAQAAQRAIVATYQSSGLRNNDPNQIPAALAAEIQAAVTAMGVDFYGRLLASGLRQAGQLAYQAAAILANDLSIGAEAVAGWLTGAGYNVDFSCYAQIHNATSGNLSLDRHDLTNGHFITLPASIPAGNSAMIWVQRDPGLHGSAATVHYRAPDGADTSFTFDCPTGVYPNSVSGGSSFQAKAGAGDWLPPGQAPSQGHPLYIRYEVTPGAQQGHFTGRCGENSQAASAAGLQPGQSVVLNGDQDLSRCMVANNNAAVFGIALSQTSGPYSYQVTVDAQGPEGLFSGSMYLYFTDQSGDRYLLTVFKHARDTHTVGYNSSTPAIMKIEWSNTA